MLKVPDITQLDMAFGKIDHMPKYDSIPAEFKRFHGNAYVDAVSSWFYSGAKAHKGGIEINGVNFVAKPGVESGKALAAIRAVLASFEPKHEHKIAGCASLLHEWFDIEKSKAA